MLISLLADATPFKTVTKRIWERLQEIDVYRRLLCESNSAEHAYKNAKVTHWHTSTPIVVFWCGASMAAKQVVPSPSAGSAIIVWSQVLLLWFGCAILRRQEVYLIFFSFKKLQEICRERDFKSSSKIVHSYLWGIIQKSCLTVLLLGEFQDLFLNKLNK